MMNHVHPATILFPHPTVAILHGFGQSVLLRGREVLLRRMYDLGNGVYPLPGA
jgi:hypothetical protein